MNLTLEKMARVFVLLDAIIPAILKGFCGIPYSGSLDKVLNLKEQVL